MVEVLTYRLKIDAYTPETMPMGRLAEYMADLAVILGERAAVHFVQLVHLAGIGDSVGIGEPSRICHSPSEI